MGDAYDYFEQFVMWGLVVFAVCLMYYLAYLQYRKVKHRRHRRRKRAREEESRAQMEMTPPPQLLREPGPQAGATKRTGAHSAPPTASGSARTPTS
jgi:hypothetical protein